MNRHTAAFLLFAICQVAFYSSEVYAAPNIVTRAQWGAKPLVTPAPNVEQRPVPYVVIHHTDTPTCTSLDKCKARVRSIQNDHITNRKWSDIGYNFLVGEDGNVYEARGWGKHGAHSVSMNSKSVGICIIGDYASRQPNAAAVNAVKSLISSGVSKGEISANYKLVGHRQTAATSCPGNSLYNLIKTWPKWVATP